MGAQDAPRSWGQGVSPEVLEIANGQPKPPVISGPERSWILGRCSIREWFDRHVRPEMAKRVDGGRLAKTTVEKYAQAIARWERHSRPQGFAGDWPGLPIGSITDATLDAWCDRMAEAGLATATIRSTWLSLRVVLNSARSQGVLDRVACPDLGNLPPDEDLVTIWSDRELVTGYQALAAWPSLQSAWVVANNCGMRSGDLFSLRWDQFSLGGQHPFVKFRAQKTKTLHVIPLAPITVAHVLRLDRSNSLVFSEWYEEKAGERSRRAQLRRALMRGALAAAFGRLPPEKPLQVCRATCNTRLNRVRDNLGQFVLGHSLGLNSKHYHEPSAMVRDGILAVIHPDEWSLPENDFLEAG